MESRNRLEVAISPALATIARRFNIDLSALADEALTERILRDSVRALTARMRTAFLVAQETALRYEQKHLGTEHIFLAILLDPHSIPSQMLNEIGVREQVVKQIETMLAGEAYNRPPEP
jgi:ATP-dependent Clp protease ATP-binding subunit ClpA